MWEVGDHDISTDSSCNVDSDEICFKVEHEDVERAAMTKQVEDRGLCYSVIVKGVNLGGCTRAEMVCFKWDDFNLFTCKDPFSVAWIDFGNK